MDVRSTADRGYLLSLTTKREQPPHSQVSLSRERGDILTFPDDSHYSGVIPMVFEHSGGRDFDLPRHSHYSGVIPMVFEHSAGRDFDLPRHSHYSGVIPMVFEHSAVGGEILTFPDTLTTQGLSLWSLNIVRDLEARS